MIKEIKRQIRELRNDCAAHMHNGRCANYEAYRDMAGRYAAYEKALEIVDIVEKQYINVDNE